METKGPKVSRMRFQDSFLAKINQHLFVKSLLPKLKLHHGNEMLKHSLQWPHSPRRAEESLVTAEVSTGDSFVSGCHVCDITLANQFKKSNTPCEVLNLGTVIHISSMKQVALPRGSPNV